MARVAIRWNLGAQFSLFLVFVCFLGCSLTIFTLSQHFHSQAEEAVRERAEILLTAMQSARDYTRDRIQPILESDPFSSDRFLPESIPNFAARTIFADFRQQNPKLADFFYKEAALNPTSISDLADEFEATIFRKLQETIQTSQLQTISGYRTLNEKQLFYLARPLIMSDRSCLQCHGQPKDAPQYLIQMYGDRNGFGWQLNEMVATQMIYVPADEILQRGYENSMAVGQVLVAIFATLFLAINVLLWRRVVRPLKILTKVAEKISNGSLWQNTPLGDRKLEKLTQQRDESGQLARAFQYTIAVLSRREQDLQQAVEERTQSLEREMRDRQTAQESLRTYSHAINHDLRNLVMGISTVIQGILFSYSKNDELVLGQIVEIEPMALGMIQKSCDRQLELMNALMDVESSNIWHIVLQRESLSLRQTIENLKTTYQPQLQAASAMLENNIPADLVNIRADPNQLQRVFENLIDNSLKYNPEGVKMVVNARLSDGETPEIYCTFSDNGVGIDGEISQELFQRYTRGKNQERSQSQPSGYGLGLYICQKIIEAHGGRIGINPSPHRGVEFWFTLPV